MNQKLLGGLRAIGLVALFGAINALMALGSHSSALNGLVALAVTGFGAGLEQELAVKLGYNLPAGKIAVSKTSALAAGIVGK